MAYTEKDYEEVNEIVREISSSPAPNENQESQETKQSSGQKLQEYDGEIGIIKNQAFVPMTNFSVRCTGYVVDDSTSTSARGFLFRVIPKDRVQCEFSIEELDGNQSR